MPRGPPERNCGQETIRKDKYSNKVKRDDRIRAKTNRSVPSRRFRLTRILQFSAAITYSGILFLATVHLIVSHNSPVDTVPASLLWLFVFSAAALLISVLTQPAPGGRSVGRHLVLSGLRLLLYLILIVGAGEMALLYTVFPYVALMMALPLLGMVVGALVLLLSSLLFGRS
jgi:hypothetical protein